MYLFYIFHYKRSICDFIHRLRKDLSIAILKVKLLNKSEIIVKAYNELADFCYKELNKEDIIFLEGYLNSKMEVIIKTIKKEE